MILNSNPKSLSDQYKGRRILITGGKGFLGTNLVDLLKDIDCHIVRLGRSGGIFEPVDGAVRLEDVTGDIRERMTWERVLEGVNMVFHFAAQTSVYVANENPSADLNINVVPMLYLLEICQEKGWRPTILFSGTVTEAGIPESLPVDETHPDIPVTIYDLHKLMAEKYLKYYTSQGIVHGVTLRIANVYGPGPKSSSADRGVLNVMIRKALKGETLSIYGKGDYLRDYVYVKDVARAFLEAGAHIERVNGQHFVIGSGEGHTLADAFKLVAERVRLKAGQRVSVAHVEPPTSQSPIETRNFVADSRRFTQATGWRPAYSLSEGIDRTVEALSLPIGPRFRSPAAALPAS